jgi:hypothetical protein
METSIGATQVVNYSRYSAVAVLHLRPSLDGPPSFGGTWGWRAPPFCFFASRERTPATTEGPEPARPVITPPTPACTVARHPSWVPGRPLRLPWRDARHWPAGPFHDRRVVHAATCAAPQWSLGSGLGRVLLGHQPRSCVGRAGDGGPGLLRRPGATDSSPRHPATSTGRQ